MTRFVHLRTYSDYSLGFGAIKVKELVKNIRKLNQPVVALTDRNNMFASLEFAMDAMKEGVQPINGIDITIEYADKTYGNLLLLAQNQVGYENLLFLSSEIYLKRSSAKSLSIEIETLFARHEGLIVLAANPINSIERHCSKANTDTFAYIEQLHQLFNDRLYIELIRRKEETREDFEFESKMIGYALDKGIPLVATNSSAFLNPSFYEAQDALSCIATGRYVIEDAREKLPKDFYLKSSQEMQELFADIPEAINNTLVVAQRCSYASPVRPPMLPEFSNEHSNNSDDILSTDALEGLKQRIASLSYEVNEAEYIERLDFELSVITRMKYSGYFLIVADFIKWSKAQGIPVGPGRGSGVGSIVAWATDITDLDPIKFGLLFERFLNPDRVSMPDFDIDFCQERREEVIHYVRRKYGDDKVAQIITFGKLQARAVLRDVGRVIHIPYPVVDKICKMVPNNPANPVTLSEAIALDKELQNSRDTDPTIERLLRVSLQLEGVNRHASTHAAGIVIADRPIIELTPLFKDEFCEMPAVQYSMKYAEAAGLVKFDFLGLKTLTVVSHAEKLIKSRGIDIIMNSVSLEDVKTYKLLASGDTVGIFQFESAGMREAIKKLRPDAIGDLIALGSLYRPGPMDNIPSYINRKHGLEKIELLHPLMEPILAETYGIIVYQEQIMEIAKVLAGYSLGEADLLRRAMGKKIKAEMEAQRDNFIQGCVKTNNITKQNAVEIFHLVEKFASYGFNKSHAAAYAIISYQTAYLKANYTIEFLIASMNLEIDDSDKINIFLNEARKFGITILPPDINKSDTYFAIEGDAIRFGLGAIKNVGTKAVDIIREERNKDGAFHSIYNLLERAPEKSINRRMFEGLAKSGAFDCFNTNRRQFFENTDRLLRGASDFHQTQASKQVALFAEDESLDGQQHVEMLSMDQWETNELLFYEFEAFGFYLSSHPLALYRSKLARLGISTTKFIEECSGSKSQKLIVAGVITSKRIKSSKRGKYAFIQISDIVGLLEISIFKEELLYKHDAILQVGKLLYFRVDVRIDDTGLRVVAESIELLDDVVAQLVTHLYVIIHDIKAVEALKMLFSDAGRSISISYKTGEGDVVSFSSDTQIFVSIENESKLYKIPGIEVREA